LRKDRSAEECGSAQTANQCYYCGVSNPRRDRIKQFLENPQLPAKFEFTHDDPQSDHRIWFSLIVAAPVPDRGHRVFWEYIAEVGFREKPGTLLSPDKWAPELAIAVFEIMKEDLMDTPFKTPKAVVERPNRGLSWIGDIAPLELIKR